LELPPHAVLVEAVTVNRDRHVGASDICSDVCSLVSTRRPSLFAAIPLASARMIR
jgi:hypothetical protein